MADNLVTCDCSLIWKIRQIKTMMRSDATLRCSCGRVLMTWSGPYMWMKERVPEPEEQ